MTSVWTRLGPPHMDPTQATSRSNGAPRENVVPWISLGPFRIRLAMPDPTRALSRRWARLPSALLSRPRFMYLRVLHPSCTSLAPLLVAAPCPPRHAHPAMLRHSRGSMDAVASASAQM